MKWLPLFVLMLIGCRSIAPEVPAFTLQAQQIAAAYGPQVEQILGSTTTHSRVNMCVQELEPGWFGAVNEERDTIILSPYLAGMPEDALRWVIVHELVHIHLTEHWDTLPPVIEEGVAESVTALLLPELVPTALPLQSEELRTGYNIVQRIGLDNLRVLATRAANQGLSRIPDIWLQDPVVYLGTL